MTTSTRTASHALATCAIALLLGGAPAAAAPILRGFDFTFSSTDSESWVEGILGVDVFMIAQVTSDGGELTGLGDWGHVSFASHANPFDDFLTHGRWSYSGDEQVAYYSLDNLLSISLWEPAPPNAGHVIGFGPEHLTLWGTAGFEPATAGLPDPPPATPAASVPEPAASLLFALGFFGIERAVRNRVAPA